MKTNGIGSLSSLNSSGSLTEESKIIKECYTALKRSRNVWVSSAAKGEEGNIRVYFKNKGLVIAGTVDSPIVRNDAGLCLTKIADKYNLDLKNELNIKEQNYRRFDSDDTISNQFGDIPQTTEEQDSNDYADINGF